jgi:hypothetical protein
VAEDVRAAYVVARYAASEGYVAYRWERGERGLRLEYTGSGETAKVLLLLPEGVAEPAAVTVDGTPHPFEREEVQRSRYVTVSVAGSGSVVEVSW